MIDNIDIAVAKREIEMASILNPGPWVAHSYNVGLAAKYIAEACGMLMQIKLTYMDSCMI